MRTQFFSFINNPYHFFATVLLLYVISFSVIAADNTTRLQKLLKESAAKKGQVVHTTAVPQSTHQTEQATNKTETPSTNTQIPAKPRTINNNLQTFDSGNNENNGNIDASVSSETGNAESVEDANNATAATARPDNSGGLSTLFTERSQMTNAAQTVDPIEPPPPLKRKPTLRDEAFKQLLDKISPLTPDQIIEMRKQQDKTQHAVSALPNTPPRPVSSTLTIDLSPGVTPPVVRLGAGYVSSLVFVDTTGQSWPIADYSLGNPKNFNIQWDRKTNTLFIQGNTTYSSGNLAVRLATLDTPVMLTLISGQREVDYRVDLQVKGRGPNALAPVVGDNIPIQNPLLLSVLDGVPPPNSTELIVYPEVGRAWIANGKLIFRTQVTILSPAWSATVSSADGTHVYEMTQTPLILGSENGLPINIELRGL